MLHDVNKLCRAPETPMTQYSLSLLMSWIYLISVTILANENKDHIFAQVDSSELLGLMDEKAWMPWPTSLKDPKKEYTTLILDPLTITDLSTITETIRVTKTVFSHLTEYSTLTFDKTKINSVTNTVNENFTKTLTLTIIERLTSTTELTTINTVPVTHTQIFESGIPQSPARLKMIYAKAITQHSTITTRPLVIVTSTKINKVFTKTTLKGVTTVTLSSNKLIVQTTVETIPYTISSIITVRDVSSSTITHTI